MKYYFLVADPPYKKSKFGEFYTKKELTGGLTEDVANTVLFNRLTRRQEGSIGIYDLEQDDLITSYSKLYSYNRRTHILYASSPQPLVDLPGGLPFALNVGTRLEQGDSGVCRFVAKYDEEDIEAGAPKGWVVPINDLVYTVKEFPDKTDKEVIEEYLYTPFVWHDTAKSWEVFLSRLSRTRNKLYERIYTVLEAANGRMSGFNSGLISTEHQRKYKENTELLTVSGMTLSLVDGGRYLLSLSDVPQKEQRWVVTGRTVSFKYRRHRESVTVPVREMVLEDRVVNY